MPAAPFYSTSNLIASAFTADAGGFDATFTSANLQDGRQSKPCKSNGSVGSWQFHADMGVSTTLNVVGFCNHNFPALTTIKIEGSADNMSYSTVMAATADAFPITAALTFNTATWRYWRFTITPQQPLQMSIGELWLAVGTQLTRNFAWKPKRGYILRKNVLEAGDQTKWVYTVGKVIRQYKLTWDDQPELQRDEIQTMLRNFTGLGLFVLIANNSNPTLRNDQEAILGAIVSGDVEFEQEMYDINSGGTVEFKEDALGVGQ